MRRCSSADLSATPWWLSTMSRTACSCPLCVCGERVGETALGRVSELAVGALRVGAEGPRG